MNAVQTVALLPKRNFIWVQASFRGTEASLLLTPNAPAAPHDTTRLGWFVVALCECQIHANIIWTLIWRFFLSCLIMKVQD